MEEDEGTFHPREEGRSAIETESDMEIGTEVRTGEIDVGKVTEATGTATEATPPPVPTPTLTLAEPETLWIGTPEQPGERMDRKTGALNWIEIWINGNMIDRRVWMSVGKGTSLSVENGTNLSAIERRGKKEKKKER